MTFAEFLFDIGTWLVAVGVFVLSYTALLWLLMFFMGGRK